MRMSLQKCSVLDALRMLSGSWLKVTNYTICNCWRRPNFILASEKRDFWNDSKRLFRLPMLFRKILAELM